MPLTKLRRSSDQGVFTRIGPGLTKDVHTGKLHREIECGLLDKQNVEECLLKWTRTDPVEEMVASSIPHSRPQAAPMSSEGMKTPADTARP